MPIEDFLPIAGQRQIVGAIERAERCTSGEIRVHVEPTCSRNPISRAVALFDELGMTATKLHNGVLIYIAYDSRKFAIIGDSGINDVVPFGFWNDAKDALASHLSDGTPVEGICEAVDTIGKKLSEFFPCQPNDINELDNEISYRD